jgi:hypothetical protein
MYCKLLMVKPSTIFVEKNFGPKRFLEWISNIFRLRAMPLCAGSQLSPVTHNPDFLSKFFFYHNSEQCRVGILRFAAQRSSLMSLARPII